MSISRLRDQFARVQRAWCILQNYSRAYGWAATFRQTGLRLRKGRATVATVPTLPATPAVVASPGGGPVATVPQWLHARYPAEIPLRTYTLPPQPRRRVTMVTDSIAKGSLFGGVGTALIFCTLLANRLDAHLRIVTRNEPPVPRNVDHVLSIYGIEVAREVQFVFASAYDESQHLDLLDKEIFVTTSWWTTAATLPSVPLSDIVYLLQEDERMFYAFGDERLRCERTLNHKDLRCVVNTSLLHDHLVAAGLPQLRHNGLHFEPAFPSNVFHPRPRTEGSKRKFVFYARPNNVRNLFFLGIEVIDRAVLAGILDPEFWEIVLVGRDIPELQFAAGPLPTRLQNLDWSQYADLIGGADLGLCLMYTPHPSYPPLDLVASGAVVVTNRHGNKQDLRHISPNLLSCDTAVDALVEGLRQGAALAQDRAARSAGHQNTRLNRDWRVALGPVIEEIARSR